MEPIDGVMVSNHYHTAVGPPQDPWPLAPGMVHPARLADALAEVRLNPNELIPEQVLPFVPKALEIDQDKDRRLASVMKILAECTSMHAAATLAMEQEPWDFMGVYYDAIDHFCHGFMKFRAPRRAHIPERDFELYQGVVDMGYQFHDMMLGAMLAKVPEDTTVIVCSDHGFHPDHLRPVQIPNEPAGPAIEHRDLGMLIMAGPGIRLVLKSINALLQNPMAHYNPRWTRRATRFRWMRHRRRWWTSPAYRKAGATASAWSPDCHARAPA